MVPREKQKGKKKESEVKQQNKVRVVSWKSRNKRSYEEGELAAVPSAVDRSRKVRIVEMTYFYLERDTVSDFCQ